MEGREAVGSAVERRLLPLELWWVLDGIGAFKALWPWMGGWSESASMGRR
jgi:hypothetical protein